MRLSPSRVFVTALALSLALVSRSSFADKPEPPSPDRLRSAAQEFDEGRRLFQEKQYSDAAVHFENAYHDAPSGGAIRAAVRARVEAKEEARAATLASIALRTTENDPATTKFLNSVVEGARPKLLELRITCEAPCEIALDGKLVSLSADTTFHIFVSPGAHQGAASFVGRTATATGFSVEGVAGQSRDIALVAKPEPPPEAVPGARRTPSEPDTPPPSRRPLSKAFFFTGLGLTIAAGGATAVSGALTLSTPGTDQVRRDCAGLDSSCTTYQAGKDAELRTNIFLGVTVGLAVVTTVFAFFTDFSGKKPSGPSATVAANARTLGLPTILRNGISF